MRGPPVLLCLALTTTAGFKPRPGGPRLARPGPALQPLLVGVQSAEPDQTLLALFDLANQQAGNRSGPAVRAVRLEVEAGRYTPARLSRAACRHVAAGLRVVVGGPSGPGPDLVSQHLTSLCRALDIPYFHTQQASCQILF